jgi:acyl-CoA thioesterase-1
MQRFSAFIYLLILCLTALASTPAMAGGSRVLIVGDSLSAAHNIPIASSWPALLQQQLDPQGVTVINASISGETTGGGRQRLPGLLERHRPDIVIIELGGNDGLRGHRFSQIRENLAAMIDLARQAGARVLLVGVRLPPNLGAAYNRRFQKIYQDLAEERNIAYLPRFLEGVADSGDASMMQADGIHPTARAQPLLADKVRRRLLPVLEALR